MSCPLTPALWHEYCEHGDTEVAAHLATCTACRTEAGRLAHLQRALSAAPQLDAPPAVAERLQRLALQLSGQSLSCADTLALLEAWRDGDLDRAQTFLVEEHLLWCAPCAQVAEAAERLSTALRALPTLIPPSVIAERLAAARVPWWQRLMPAPAPSLAHAGLAIGGLAAALLFAVLVNAPHRSLDTAKLPSGNTIPRSTGVAPRRTDTAVSEMVIPDTPGITTDRHASMHSRIITTPVRTRTNTAVVVHDGPLDLQADAMRKMTSHRNTTVTDTPANINPPASINPSSETEHSETAETLIAMAPMPVDDASFRCNAEDAVVDSFELAMLAADEQSLYNVGELHQAIPLVRNPQRYPTPDFDTNSRSLRPVNYQELGTSLTKEVREKDATIPLRPLTNSGDKHKTREIEELTILRTDI